MKNMDNKKGFIPILIVVGVVALVAIVIIIFRSFNGSTSQLTATPQLTANAILASITSVAVAKGIDAKGNPVGVSKVFSSTKDKQLYVVLSLKNATKNTTLAYTRYLSGKFIDSKVMHPTTNGAANVYFAFEKGVGSYPKGNYRVVAYVNGKRSVETTYSFQ